MDLLLNDKVALVTGAGSGIGASIAAILAREGCVVCIADLRLELAQKIEKDLKKEGGKAFSAQLDVGDPKQVEQVVRRVVDVYGRIDILVNNAGILKTGPIVDSSVHDRRKVWKDRQHRLRLGDERRRRSREHPVRYNQGGGSCDDKRSRSRVGPLED